jgi:hypothetical protein
VKKIFLGPYGAKDPRNITARKFHSRKQKTMLFIYKKNKKNTQQGGEAYASSGSRSNRSATAQIKKAPSKAGRPTRLQAHARTARLRRAQHLQRRPWRLPQVLQRALAPLAPGRCWGHGFGSTSTRARPPPVLERSPPPPDGKFPSWGRFLGALGRISRSSYSILLLGSHLRRRQPLQAGCRRCRRGCRLLGANNR